MSDLIIFRSLIKIRDKNNSSNGYYHIFHPELGKISFIKSVIYMGAIVVAALKECDDHFKYYSIRLNSFDGETILELGTQKYKILEDYTDLELVLSTSRNIIDRNIAMSNGIYHKENYEVLRMLSNNSVLIEI